MRLDSFSSKPTVVDAYDIVDHSHLVSNIRQTQVIGLVTGIIASILLLNTLLMLIIPSVPVAATIVVGSALLVMTAVSLVAFALYFIKIKNVLKDLTEASADLRRSFINCALELAHSFDSPKELKPIKEVQPTQILSSTSEDSSSPIVPQVPSISLTLEGSPDPIEQTTSSALDDAVSEVEAESSRSELEKGERIEEIAEELFISKRTEQLLVLFHDGKMFPTIEKLPKHKKESQKVDRQFSSLCIGITNLLNKIKNKESPVTPIEAVSMFFRPLMGCDSHSVLRITCNAKDLLSNPLTGEICLHNLLTDPTKANSLLELVEFIKSLPHIYIPFLRLLNFLLSGWCLSNANTYPYIVGSIQTLSIPKEQRELVITLLSSGNVLGALSFFHGRNHKEWKEVFAWPVDEKQEQPRESMIPMDVADLVCLRNLVQSIDEDEAGVSEGREEEKLFQQIRDLLSPLSELLPANVLGLVASVARKDSPLSKHIQKIIKFFDQNQCNSLNKIFAIVRAVRSIGAIQTRLQAYLPYAGKESAGSVLSTLILGGFVLGVFTRRQMSTMAQALGISSQELENAIIKKEVDKIMLPKLFK